MQHGKAEKDKEERGVEWYLYTRNSEATSCHLDIFVLRDVVGRRGSKKDKLKLF